VIFRTNVIFQTDITVLQCQKVTHLFINKIILMCLILVTSV